MPTFEEELAALRGKKSAPSDFESLLSSIRGGKAKEVDLRATAAERVKKLKANSAAAEEPGFVRSFLGEVIPSPQALGTMASAIGARGPEKMIGAWGDIGSGIANAQGEQFYEAAEAYNRGDVVGGLEHVRAGVTPIVGPALQDARESFSGGNIVGAAGRALGVAANLVAPEAAAGVVNKAKGLAPTIRANAERQYAGAFTKSKRVEPLVEEITPELLDRGVTFRDPKQLAANAEDAAAAVNTDDAVLNMQNPVHVGPIRQELRKQKTALFNEVERIPAPPKDQLDAAVKALKKQHRGATVEVDGTDLVVYKIRHPDMGGKAQRIGKLDSHIKGSADRSGVLTNENALNLRKDYDYYSNPEEIRFEDIPDVRKPADAHVAETLRKEINADPVVGAANTEKSFWLDVKKVADATPQGKHIADVLMENAKLAGAGAVARTVGVPFGGEVAMVAAAWRVIRDIPKTAQWRTASAVQKIRFAKALQSGDISTAAKAGADIIAGSAIMDNVIE